MSKAFHGSGNYPSTTWRKSSYSGNGTNCVEVAITTGGVTGFAVRDSKDTSIPGISVAAGAWSAFVRSITEQR